MFWGKLGLFLFFLYFGKIVSAVKSLVVLIYLFEIAVDGFVDDGYLEHDAIVGFCSLKVLFSHEVDLVNEIGYEKNGKIFPGEFLFKFS